MLATRRASSIVSTFAVSASAFVSRPIDIRERLPVGVLHDIATGDGFG